MPTRQRKENSAPDTTEFSAHLPSDVRSPPGLCPAELRVLEQAGEPAQL